MTLIEPSFLNVLPAKPANDDHPPTDIQHGQDMIACIYNSLVSSPQWGTTLFIITYDEHGGFYDHVGPPGTRRSTTTVPVHPIHPKGPSFYGPRCPGLCHLAVGARTWRGQHGVRPHVDRQDDRNEVPANRGDGSDRTDGARSEPAKDGLDALRPRANLGRC